MWCTSEMWNEQCKTQQPMFILGALGYNSFMPGVSQLLEATCTPWLMASSFFFKARGILRPCLNDACFWHSLFLCLWPLCNPHKDPAEYAPSLRFYGNYLCSWISSPSLPRLQSSSGSVSNRCRCTLLGRLLLHTLGSFTEPLLLVKIATVSVHVPEFGSLICRQLQLPAVSYPGSGVCISSISSPTCHSKMSNPPLNSCSLHSKHL